MNVIISVIYYILIVLFMFGYIACFILNLIRAVQVNKGMKEEYNTIKAKVIEVIKEKKRVFVKVEYLSTANFTKFVDFYEFTEREFNDQYYVDQELEIYYPKVDKVKRVTCFPTYLEGEKIKIKSAPIVTDVILAVVGILMTGWFTSLVIKLGGQTLESETMQTDFTFPSFWISAPNWERSPRPMRMS